MTQESGPTANPPKRRIVTLPFDQRAIPAIAELLGGEARLADFRLPDAAVHQILAPGKDGRPATMLTLWPSLRRVDAIAPGITVVFTAIETVDLVEGVEALFRRSNRDYLIVAVGGKVIVRA
jgi:hypothetical protein